MELQTEAGLRGDRHLIGQPMRMLDGALWKVPSMPVDGPISDRMIELAAQYWAQVDTVKSGLTSGDYAAQMKALLRPAADLAFEALRLNYPDITRETMQRIVVRAHIEDMIHAINGTAQLRELAGQVEGPAGNAPPAA